MRVGLGRLLYPVEHKWASFANSDAHLAFSGALIRTGVDDIPFSARTVRRPHHTCSRLGHMPQKVSWCCMGLPVDPLLYDSVTKMTALGSSDIFIRSYVEWIMNK